MEKSAIRAAAEAASSRVDKDDALASLRSAVEKVVSRVRQNMVGLVRDNAQSALARFSATLQSRLIDLCQVWVGQQSQQVVPVLPDNCKYYTKVGDWTVIVLEHKPQVRSLLFAEGLLDGCPDRSTLSESQRTGVPCAVSLPYIVFTITFHANKFSDLRVNFRTKPLENLNDQLYYPALPNFSNGDSKVCFGQIYGDEKRRLNGMSLHQQIADVINTFYGSVFNSDYPDYYKYICQSTPNMRTLRHWIANTKTDPAFILKVQYKPHCTLKDLVNRVGGGQQTIGTSGLSNAFSHEMERSLKDISGQIESWLAQSAKDIQPDNTSVTRALTENLSKLVETALMESLAVLQSELVRERILLEQERMRMIELLQEKKVGYGGSRGSPYDDEYDSWRKETW
jgi:hypothetical protein